MQEVGQLAILGALKMIWESFMQSSICICTPVTHLGRFGNYVFLVIFLHIRRGEGELGNENEVTKRNGGTGTQRGGNLITLLGCGGSHTCFRAQRRRKLKDSLSRPWSFVDSYS